MSEFQGPNDFGNILTESGLIDYNLGVDYSNLAIDPAENTIYDPVNVEGSFIPQETAFGFEESSNEELFGPGGMSITRHGPMALFKHLCAAGNLEIAQAIDGTSGLVEPASFPAICSAFQKINPDNSVSSFTPVYGEDGLDNEGKIQGFFTEFRAIPAPASLVDHS